MHRERSSERCVGYRIRWREGHDVNDVVDHAINRGHKPADQSVRTVGDGLEYGLQVARRTGDNLQNLSSRRLLLAGLLQLPDKTRTRRTFRSNDGRRIAPLELAGLAALC